MTMNRVSTRVGMNPEGQGVLLSSLFITYRWLLYCEAQAWNSNMSIPKLCVISHP